MKKTLLIINLLFCIGCASFPPMSPKEKFNVTAKTFLATIRTLKVLKDTGKLSEEESERIGNLNRIGYSLMDTWYQALETGLVDIKIIDALEAILNELIQYEKGAADVQ